MLSGWCKGDTCMKGNKEGWIQVLRKRRVTKCHSHISACFVYAWISTNYMLTYVASLSLSCLMTGLFPLVLAANLNTAKRKRSNNYQMLAFSDRIIVIRNHVSCFSIFFYQWWRERGGLAAGDNCCPRTCAYFTKISRDKTCVHCHPC